MKQETYDWLYGMCDYMQGYDTKPCGECCKACKQALEEAKPIGKLIEEATLK